MKLLAQGHTQLVKFKTETYLPLGFIPSIRRIYYPPGT